MNRILPPLAILPHAGRKTYLQVLGELPQGKEASAAHHLVAVRQTLTHCLQHGGQHPDTHTYTQRQVTTGHSHNEPEYSNTVQTANTVWSDLQDTTV